MIFDQLSQHHLYHSIHPGISAGLRFLHETDLASLGEGKHLIDEESLFVLINHYDTKPASEASLEAHRKYIDIQYMISGEELMGHVLFSGQNARKEYDEADDYALYEGNPHFFRIRKGQFCIFLPDDLHMPGIQDGPASPVRKAVVKVRI
jgi:YhcH/YjgK/YiaL family protein